MASYLRPLRIALTLRAPLTRKNTPCALRFSRWNENFKPLMEEIATEGNERIIYLPSVEITIPKVTRDLLILAPSFNLSPAAPLELARSLPTTTYKNKLHYSPPDVSDSTCRENV